MANKMNNTKRRTIALILVLTMIMSFSTLTAMASEGSEQGIQIPVTKTWDDNGDQDGIRPEAINIDLYRYSDASFDIEKAEKIATTTLTANNDWQGHFNVQQNALLDGKGNPYKLQMVEANAEGYEAEYNNPEVSLETVPFAVSTEWTRVTPCNQLSINLTGDNKSAVVMKKGNEYVVWTLDELTATEKTILFEAAAKGIKGFGQGRYDNATFINGLGSKASGMTVTSTQITFDNKKDWSFFGTGTYSAEYAVATVGGATVTNKHIPATVDVKTSLTWDDVDNADNLRPDSVEVKIFADGEEVKDVTIVLNDKNNWSDTFIGLPVNNNGEKIEYTIKADDVDSYVAEGSGDAQNGFVISEYYRPTPQTEEPGNTDQDEQKQDTEEPKKDTVAQDKDPANNPVKDTAENPPIDDEDDDTTDGDQLIKPIPADKNLVIDEQVIDSSNDEDDDLQITEGAPKTGDNQTQSFLLYIFVLAISALAVLRLRKSSEE